VELFTAQWFSALLSIVLIDLVLAGDNALVIAMAARQLPAEYRRKVIIWGTVGAIALRCAMTLVVVWLLKIPGLMLLGGLGLLWVAYDLLAAKSTESSHASASGGFWAAFKTILIADALMGIDNVLGVAGAAHGAWDLVIIGLLISVPIVVWGSQLVLTWIERYPSIIYIGAAVLALTAAKMILGEPWIAQQTAELPVLRWATTGLLMAAVLAAGRWSSQRRATVTHG
jgi:YjbE family integral membrane protein